MVTFKDIQIEIKRQELGDNKLLSDDIGVSSWDYFKSRNEDEDDSNLFTVSWTIYGSTVDTLIESNVKRS